jgi:hypothetical protein
MTRLSPQAKSALESLHEKHLAYTIAKSTIESELKREASNRLSSIRQERDMALRLASDSGVPKTQLGKAIGTSNYRTVQEILAETENVIRPGSVDTTNKGNIIVERSDEEGIYSISISNFGENSLTGTARFTVQDEEVVYFDGEPFVLPQVYRAGFESFVMEQINLLKY